jgi:hypothetical protein
MFAATVIISVGFRVLSVSTDPCIVHHAKAKVGKRTMIDMVSLLARNR